MLQFTASKLSLIISNCQFEICHYIVNITFTANNLPFFFRGGDKSIIIAVLYLTQLLHLTTIANFDSYKMNEMIR